MKRWMGWVLVGAVMAFAAHSAMGAAVKAKPAAEKKPQVLIGEVVDTGCYGGHGARGEKHKECATKCISEGMPMGLLTKDGKLYLLTMNHDNTDPYNKAKEMAASMVAVTGPVMEAGGMRMIEVDEIKPAQ